MAKIVIDGVSYIGDKILVRNNVLYIDSQVISLNQNTPTIDIRIVEGVVADVSSDGNIECQNVYGNVDAGGNVTCKYVSGNVDAGGNVVVEEVRGDIDAGGNVSIRNPQKYQN
jgi:Iap family predicted aminopeptidase